VILNLDLSSNLKSYVSYSIASILKMLKF
jgi:hypothetical protein